MLPDQQHQNSGIPVRSGRQGHTDTEQEQEVGDSERLVEEGLRAEDAGEKLILF